MNSTLEYFLATKPAYPWSVYPIGLPGLALVAILLAALTIATYSGRAARGKILIVMALRLLALAVVLLTALRPSLGVQEDPKVPSTLLIGIDLSESMGVKDELGNQARLDAVKRMLDKASGTIEDLKSEQNVNVVFYGFGSPDFREADASYDSQSLPTIKKSDYGVYLQRTLERWQGTRFVRGHLLIGDGADNGATTSAISEAGKWRSTSPINTFLCGTQTPPGAARDVGFTDVSLEPDPVAVKNEVTLRARVFAYGFAGVTVPIKVQYDLGDGSGFKDVTIENVKLAKEKDNAIEIKLRAPDKLPEGGDKKPRKQIKVRAEIPMASVPGDIAPANNVVETYLNLTKEGLRVLIVDRYRYEYSLLLDALAADPRIDVRKVDLQTDEGGPGLREAFDFDDKAYDVLILGNISARQLIAIDPALPQRIAERVLKHGMGLAMIGGHATFSGTTGDANATGWRGVKPIEDILPVFLGDGPVNVDPTLFKGDKSRFQVVLNPRFTDFFVTKLGNTPAESLAAWAKLNDRTSRSRFTGLSNLGTPRPTADVYAWASDAKELVDATKNPDGKGLAPLLVGHNIGERNKGRVLAFGAQDTMLWQRLGQPAANDGKQIHSRFWRQLVLWLAHQEEDEGAAFARPDFPRLPVGAKQGIAVGLRGKNGAVVIDPKFEVKVFAPGDAIGTPRPVIADSNGGSKVNYDIRTPGEYTVIVKATGKTAMGEDVTGEATAKFLAYPETSDELLRTAADPDFMQKLAAAGGGKAMRLEELPDFLKEIQGSKLENVKPKPRYYPNWNRNESKGFLPAWLVLFVLLLGLEWGLRRFWGMV